MSSTPRCLACVALLTACLASLTVSASVEIIADPPVKFLDDEKKAKFIIGIDRDGDAPEPSSLPGTRHMVMADKTGRRFSCKIPPVANATKDGPDSGALQRESTPSELLDGLIATCFYRQEDWWTYEVCYKKHVRQFHREQRADGSIQTAADFSLGLFNESGADSNRIQVDSSPGQKDLKYVGQIYEGGDACDITSGKRQTEVRYTCGDGNKDLIVAIKEPATCKYTMVVRTPRLCKHPKFQVEEVQVSHILCWPIDLVKEIPSQEQVPDAAGDPHAAAAKGEEAADAAEEADAATAADAERADSVQADTTVHETHSTRDAAEGADAATAADAERADSVQADTTVHETHSTRDAAGVHSAGRQQLEVVEPELLASGAEVGDGADAQPEDAQAAEPETNRSEPHDEL